MGNEDRSTFGEGGAESSNPDAVHWGPTYGQLKRQSIRYRHYIIQDAAVNRLPGYSRFAAPARQMDGPSTNPDTPHGRARTVQKQRGGGTFGAERRIAYKALRKARLSKSEARREIERADLYFMGNGVAVRIPRGCQSVRGTELIDANKVSRTLMHIIRLLVEREFEELERFSANRRVTAEDLRRVADDYPHRLVMPPDDSPETLVWDWDEVAGTSSTVYTLDVYLWDDDGTRSELTLSLTLKESSGDMYIVELDDLLVR